MAGQQEVVNFLASPAAYGSRADRVERIETHGALLFLAGKEVYKIKRAVRYSYMDFSSLAKREAVCRRELALNQPGARQIYLDVVPITRETSGELTIDGSGEVLEWAIHMRRFDEHQLLSRVVERGQFSARLASDLAAVVAQFHDRAAPLVGSGGAARLEQVMNILHPFFAPGVGLSARVCQLFREQSTLQFAKVSALLEARGENGFVVRGHGDLHLSNIVVLDGHPVLFDALEFSESLATVDVLYDLAFLLMDLVVQGCPERANLILNRYLFARTRPESLAALAALPLFLALRAGVRAMVAMQRSAQVGADPASVTAAETYLDQANRFLAPIESQLVAIGGLSGTGKTSLARDLAPTIGGPVGAVHLRSDLERKAMFGVAETARLPDHAYSGENSKKIYALLLAKAQQALEAGHSVVIDAVHLDEHDRQAVEALAQTCGVPFAGFWLQAPKQAMHERVDARRFDASDATPAVVDQQSEKALGEMTWSIIDAGGTPEETLCRVQAEMGDGD